MVMIVQEIRSLYIVVTTHVLRVMNMVMIGQERRAINIIVFVYEMRAFNISVCLGNTVVLYHSVFM